MKPVLARLSGRCANGAERGKGTVIHVVFVAEACGNDPAWMTALCGAKAGRRSGCGFVEVGGADAATCPRCQKRADKMAAAKEEA